MNAMDKVDLFRTIVCRFGGQCDLNNISDTETQYKVQDLLFNSADTWFRVEGRVTSVCLPGLGICEEYSEGHPCTKQECNDLHVCTGLVLGSCEKGAKCKLFHRLKNEHNNNVIRKFPGLTEDDILLYLQVILRKKEESKPEPKGTSIEPEGTSVEPGGTSIELEGASVEPEGTGIEPEGTSVEPERASIEQIKSGKAKETLKRSRNSRRRQLKLKKVSANRERDARDEAVDDVNTAVRISEENNSGGSDQTVLRETWKDQLSSNVGGNKETHVEIKVLQEHSETTGSRSVEGGRQPEEDIITKASGGRSTSVGQETAQRTIHRLTALKFLLKQEKGVCGLKEFTEGVRFTDPEATLHWINSPTGQRVCKLFQPSGQAEALVVTCVPYLDLCSNYGGRNCTAEHCFKFHICRNYLEGTCIMESCELVHSITDPMNMKAISVAGIESLSSQEILQAVRFSLPQICVEYNSEEGCTSLVCTRFHICAEFAKGRCISGGDSCSYEHNLSSFTTRGLVVFYDKEQHAIIESSIIPGYQELLSIPRKELVDLHPQNLGLEKAADNAHQSSSVTNEHDMVQYQLSSCKSRCGTSTKMFTVPATDTINTPAAIPSVVHGCGNSTVKASAPGTKSHLRGNSTVAAPKITMVKDSDTWFPFDTTPLDSGFYDIFPMFGYDQNESQSPNLLSVTYAGVVTLAKNTEVESTVFPTCPMSGSPSLDNNVQGQVVKHLLQCIDGCTSLVDLHKNLQNEFPTSTELLAWLAGPIGKKICVIQNAITPHETTVMLLVRKFQLCFYYCSSKGCKTANCPFLHLCRHYIKATCVYSHCKFSHDPMNGHNQSIVKQCGVPFDSNDDIRLAIKHSIPKVCEGHNSTKGCQGTMCNRFHICANFVRKMCSFQNCKKGHHLQTPHNMRLLSTLTLLESVVFKSLLVTFPLESTKLVDENCKRDSLTSVVTAKIDKMNIIHCLLNHSKDSVTVEQLIGFKELRGLTSDDLVKWLKGPQGQDVCRVLLAKSSGRCLVSLGLRDFRLCFRHACPQGCQNSTCPFLHLCREYVGGVCVWEPCKFGHDIRKGHNLKVTRKAGMESFTDDEIIKAIRRSVPNVCPEHNERTMGCQESCMKFHICADYIRHRCSTGKGCPKGHNMTSPHNQDLLAIHGMAESTMYKMLVVPPSQGSANSKLSFKHSPMNENKNKLENMCLEEFLPIMFKDFNGYCSMKQFLATFPVVLTAPESLELINKPSVQKYMTLFNLGGEVMVLAKVRGLGLCFDYKSAQGCQKSQCPFIHLCKQFLVSSCAFVNNCKYSHSITDIHNSKVLSSSGILKTLPENLALKLIQNSLPAICQAHNSEKGCQDKMCNRFHVCVYHVLRSCTRISDKCVYGHSFETAHNKNLLDLYQCNSKSIKGKVIATFTDVQ